MVVPYPSAVFLKQNSDDDDENKIYYGVLYTISHVHTLASLTMYRYECMLHIG